MEEQKQAKRKRDEKISKFKCGEDASPNSKQVKKTSDHNDGDILGADILALILGYLNWKDILKARVNKKWQEGARLTSVPGNFLVLRRQKGNVYVKDRRFFCALKWISKALPGLHTVHMEMEGANRFGFQDGEEPEQIGRPYEQFYGFHDRTGVLPDLNLEECISNFNGLKQLILDGTQLNGCYPFLFQYSGLEVLDLGSSNEYLRWDLSQLSGLPKLRKLSCARSRVTGNVKSFRVLKNTLEDLSLWQSESIQGSLHELADFPHLRRLNLISCSQIQGDFLNIKDSDFQSMESLGIDDDLFREINFIEEAPLFMETLFKIKKRRHPNLLRDRRFPLSEKSSDFHNCCFKFGTISPMSLQFVYAGTRTGWRWASIDGADGCMCEVHWLDPEPQPSDEDYEQYEEDLAEINEEMDLFKGFLIPPTRQQVTSILSVRDPNPDGRQWWFNEERLSE